MTRLVVGRSPAGRRTRLVGLVAMLLMCSPLLAPLSYAALTGGPGGWAMLLGLGLILPGGVVVRRVAVARAGARRR